MDLMGLGVILFAALLWAIFIKGNEKLDYGISTKLFWEFLIAFPIVALVMGNIQFGNIIGLSPISWFYLLMFIFFVTIGGYGFLHLSATKVGSTKTAIVEFLEPVIGVILAIIIFSEGATMIQIGGWFLVMLSIFNIKRIVRRNA